MARGMKMAKRKGFGRKVRRVRRRVGVALVRAGRSARKTASEHKREFITPAVAAATAGAVGYLDNPERVDGMQLPSVAGIMPEALWAVGLGVLGTMVAATARGTQGKVVRGAATGLAAVAAYKLGSGKPIRVGEDDVGYEED